MTIPTITSINPTNTTDNPTTTVSVPERPLSAPVSAPCPWPAPTSPPAAPECLTAEDGDQAEEFIDHPIYGKITTAELAEVEVEQRQELAGALYGTAAAIVRCHQMVPYEALVHAANVLKQFLNAWCRHETLPRWTDEIEHAARDSCSWWDSVTVTAEDERLACERRAEQVAKERADEAALATPCPSCHAAPGDGCKTKNGRVLGTEWSPEFHGRRHQQARWG